MINEIDFVDGARRSILENEINFGRLPHLYSDDTFTDGKTLRGSL